MYSVAAVPRPVGWRSGQHGWGVNMAPPVGTRILDGLRPGMRVFVSAGAAGIGRAIADTLVQHGARIHVCDVSEEALDDFKRRHPTHGATLADVSSETDVAGAFHEMASSLGGLDALVNNAGIAGPTKPVEEISPV